MKKVYVHRKGATRAFGPGHKEIPKDYRKIGQPILIPGLTNQRNDKIDPREFPLVKRTAPHGGPWFMDSMQAHIDEEISWFKINTPLVKGVGPMSRVLGPADWAHGINRPVQNVLADPNPNLSVHLVRPPQDEWIGVKAKTLWDTDNGSGQGQGTLWDVYGEIGSVAMSVALMPFPTSNS